MIVYNFLKSSFSAKNQFIEDFISGFPQDFNVKKIRHIFCEDWFVFLTNPPEKNGDQNGNTKEFNIAVGSKTENNDPEKHLDEVKSKYNWEEGIPKESQRKENSQTIGDNNVFSIFEGYEESPAPQIKKKEILFGKEEKEEDVALLNSEHQAENKIIDDMEKLKLFILYFFAASINQRDENLESKLNEDIFFDLFKSIVYF